MMIPTKMGVKNYIKAKRDSEMMLQTPLTYKKKTNISPKHAKQEKRNIFKVYFKREPLKLKKKEEGENQETELSSAKSSDTSSVRLKKENSRKKKSSNKLNKQKSMGLGNITPARLMRLKKNLESSTF